MDKVAANLALGRAGEDAAVRAYRQAGYAVLARNWRCPLGEIDLILEGGGPSPVVVFCEVKARRGTATGRPFEAVTAPKQRKLRLLALSFLLRTGRTASAVRFDVASVTVDPAGGMAVHVFEDAF